MENIRSTFLFIFGCFWFFVQIALVALILVIFTFWAATVQILNLNLKNKFILAGIFWKFGSNLMVRVGLLCSPIKIDRRSAAYKSNFSQALYISNHLSMWDIPLIITTYQIVPILKKELMHIPIFGLIAKASTAIPVDRQNSASRSAVVKEVYNRLKMGLPIQFYPEGTRSRNHYPKPISEIKTTLLELAYKENIAVIPSAIWGTQFINSKYGITNFPVKLGIIVQREIYPADFPNAQAFIQACWENVINAHRELDDLMKSN